MAIKAILQSVDGRKENEVIDFNYSLASVWPVGDDGFPLLQHIDPYGHTIFNGLQMPQVQRELDVLIGRASTDEQREVLRRIRDLAVICPKKPQMLLRFRGD